MNEHDIQQVLKRIRTVVYHVGTLEGSFPRILKNAPVYTRSHLIVFYEILPYLKHLLEFSSDTIPVIGKILGLATEGKSDLEKASEYLRTINQSSETAVTEIFGTLDQVGASLRKAQQAESADDEQKKLLQEANMQLMGIMNALQFQDITSQKIEATHALLANLGDGLVDLIRDLGVEMDKHTIEVREGTYDASATFDRARAGKKQGEIDDLVDNDLTNHKASQNGQVSSKEKSAPAQSVSSQKGQDTDVVDDIDDLVASAKDEGDDAVVDVDDIDDLVASAKDEGDDAVVDVDDIDDLVASAKDEGDEDETEEQENAQVEAAQDGKVEEGKDDLKGGDEKAANEPFSQDDIDALLDQ